MQDILEQDITYLTGVGPHRREILSKELGIETFGDLLEYYPYKYVDRTKVYAIRELSADMPFVQIRGRVLSFEETQLSPRKSMLVAHFSDGHSVCDLVWFNGLKYVRQNVHVQTEYVVFGKPSVFKGRFQFQHPEVEDISKVELNNMGMQPYYVTTERMIGIMA